jgi:ArsR family transcriptional regulator, virulence genes transcriptional regulator
MDMISHTQQMVALGERAEDVAELLGAMANAKRLLTLCSLLDSEKTVSDLAEVVGLNTPALSQHLAKMRAMRLVATRRHGQNVYYRLASPEVREVLQTLHRIYCSELAA